MTRHIRLVTGATGTGKTGYSTELARRYAAPVLVLDRVQCHPELAVGSGRPAEAEYDRTRRIYLADRAVAEGVIDPELAVSRLRVLLGMLWADGNEFVILEGGSISIIRRLALVPNWVGRARLAVDYVSPIDQQSYRFAIRERASAMLRTGHGGMTMVDEFHALWPDPSTHEVLMGIVGYRELADYHARTGGLRPTDEVVDSVVRSHLAYARLQLRALPVALRRLERAASQPIATRHHAPDVAQTRATTA